MSVAIDFDNTIVAYDDLFVVAAIERNLVPGGFSGTKQVLRGVIRQRSAGESEWRELQGLVYGELIARAPAFPGAREFMICARECGAHVAIVSHKTEFAGASRSGPNLQQAARRWLALHGMTGKAVVAAKDVYFEPSRAAKIARIRALEADIAIDDLVEVLTHRFFPRRTRRWLFAPHGAIPNACEMPNEIQRFECFAHWSAMQAALERCSGLQKS